MKTLTNSLAILAILLMQCKSVEPMTNQQRGEEVTLQDNEESAVFLAVNRIDIFKIKGFEFYHSFLMILTRKPLSISTDFEERTKLFFDFQTRNNEENQII